MKRIIYIKYGELTLKGKNRKHFVSVLSQNVKRALCEFKNIIIDKKFDCMILKNIDNNQLEDIVQILKFIPGIYYISTAIQIENDINIIKKNCVEIALENYFDGATFRITCHRHDKNYFLTSNEIISIVAGEILENSKYQVNLKKYSLNINIEIKKDCAIIFTNQIRGLGGLPVGSNGRVLVLLSGGIDSPIASKLLLNRGLNVDFLTFITPPHTSEKALEKVRKLSQLISIDNKISNSKLFICNFTMLMHELTHINKESYRITLMRRYFLKIAKYLKEKYGYHAIATGDSIGQVASQTLESMDVISSSINDCLILRPLLTFDKEQIISLAKFYGTYETSILPYNDSCSLFAPKNPTTKPNIQTVLELEEKLVLIDNILDNVIKNHIWIEEFYNGTWSKKN
ncbi:MAG: tRNA 4-thiouridine(8) synthase ThiI [Candidatus Ureaplasma intestinipullorum]|uniref:Probable tRNA sulfurtransferase n=1 Tax=Candidatus Ureaplasma intestinipullorum TaxID=2838770 RepID=A0A9E2NW50_9BACT|nr:tRNA 4-thiouridine(8) synthase ThiI [Candidatus Ureaplasma intestinipullorum]